MPFARATDMLSKRLDIPPIALVSLGLLLFEHVGTITLTRYTQQRDGVPRCASTVAVLYTELLKLGLSVAMELTGCCGLGSNSAPSSLVAAVCGLPRDTLRLAVPALLYTVQNNLIYQALANLEVVVFQCLYQSKLMLTALLSVMLLGKRFSFVQWVSLVLLTVGVIAVETSSVQQAAGTVPNATAAPLAALRRPASAQLGPGFGAAATVVAAALSSFAGVYFEGVVKKLEPQAPSLWVRNVQLCCFTIPIALCSIVGAVPVSGIPAAFTRGFDGPMGAVVALNAVGGLIIALVIKYGDNVLKNFVTSCSVIAGTLVSVFLFGFRLTHQFALGSLLVVASALAYSLAPAAAPAPAPPPADDTVSPAAAERRGVAGGAAARVVSPPA